MKSCLRTLVLLIAFGWSAPAAWAKPKLVVLIVVDQMRADYLERFRADFNGGFARLAGEGAVFTQARFHQVPTETAPGHATLSTGRTPSEHGITGNQWWDPAAQKIVYAVDDAACGPGPGALLADTVGSALKARDPAAQVLSVAGKDRAAILLAGPSANAALWHDKKSGQFQTSACYGALPKWAAEYNRHRPESGASLEPEALDALTAKLALSGVKAMKLGKDSHPDWLAVGFSGTDLLGHRYGSESPEIKRHILALDKILGDFLRELDRSVGAKNYAVALASDHGILTHPESMAGENKGVRRLPAADFHRRLEKALQARFDIVKRASDNWILSFHPPHLVLNWELAGYLGITWTAFLQETSAIVRQLPEVADVYAPALASQTDILSAGGQDEAQALFRRSCYPPRSGDLMVLFKENMMYAQSATDAHGSASDEDSHIPLIFWGQGIRPGVYDEPADAADVAPTIARMLEIAFPTSPGSGPLQIFD